MIEGTKVSDLSDKVIEKYDDLSEQTVKALSISLMMTLLKY